MDVGDGFVSVGTGVEAPGTSEGHAFPVRGGVGWAFARRDRPFVDVLGHGDWMRFLPGMACWECGPEDSSAWTVGVGARLYVTPRTAVASNGP